MSQSIVLSKHEMVVDREDYEALNSSHAELLEACKALLAALNAPYHEMDDDACIEILESAIAKAEGRT